MKFLYLYIQSDLNPYLQYDKFANIMLLYEFLVPKSKKLSLTEQFEYIYGIPKAYYYLCFIFQ